MSEQKAGSKNSVIVRGLKIGGGAPCSIQSMTNVDTRDEAAVLAQISALSDAGCDIVRLAIPDMEAADSFAHIRKKVDMPLVADIHFDYRLAIAAIEAGCDKVRINPGNIGARDRIKAVADKAKERRIPIRVGVNSGSLEKDILQKNGGVSAEGLVESALRNVRILEDMDFEDIVISIKSSDVVMNTHAYRMISKMTDHPLHIGVTEAGTKESGKIKSAVGLGALLIDGIGDTMRVSLTGDPVEEVIAARKILAATGTRPEPIDIISCPTCGRTEVDLEKVARETENRLRRIGDERQKNGKPPLVVAVMGCPVNGPGEAASADFGVACGKGKGVIFACGKPIETVKESEIVDKLAELAEKV